MAESRYGRHLKEMVQFVQTTPPELRRVQAEPVKQRQDSLTDQMQMVYEAANRLGCYDAASWIRANFGDV